LEFKARLKRKMAETAINSLDARQIFDLVVTLRRTELKSARSAS
jgi:hypothetical protein